MELIKFKQFRTKLDDRYDQIDPNDSSFQIFEKNEEKIGCSVIICEISWIIAHINNHMIRDVSLKVL